MVRETGYYDVLGMSPEKVEDMNGLSAMDAINRETVDLEHVPVEEVFEHPKCIKEGLTSEAAQQRVGIFGYNKARREMCDAVASSGRSEDGGRLQPWW